MPGASVALTPQTGSQKTTTTNQTGMYRFGAVPAGRYELSVVLSGFTPAIRTDIVVSESEVMVPAIVLAVAGIGEAIVVSASRVESTLIDAPATMTVMPGATLAVSAGAELWRCAALRSRLNVIQMSARDINLTSRQATGTLATSQLALAGWPLDLSRFLWAGSLGLRANQSERHQANRSRSRSSLGRVGRQCTDRRREHHYEAAARDARCDELIFNGGYFDRDAGSTVGRGAGAMYGAGVSTSQVVSDRGRIASAPGISTPIRFPVPSGQIPVDPRSSRSLGLTRSGAPLSRRRGGCDWDGVREQRHQPAEVRRTRGSGIGRRQRDIRGRHRRHCRDDLHRRRAFDIQPGLRPWVRQGELLARRAEARHLHQHARCGRAQPARPRRPTSARCN